jgi:hypothetical protein
MLATFTPMLDGIQISLATAAANCGFVGFDWQQTVEHLPPPSDPSKCGLLLPKCPATTANPTTPLTAPPAFFDPPEGGYYYLSLFPSSPSQNAYPFYYNRSLVPTGCAYFDFELDKCTLHITENNGNTLSFFDEPTLPLLPHGEFVGFKTRLVGIVSDSVAPVLAEWTWTSTYNGDNGGIGQTASFSSASIANGTGGVTITSINGVPQVPPKVTCATNSGTLWPPNGKSVMVTVSGMITAGTSALTATTYSVQDEYSQVQPSGNIALGTGGSYSLQIPLIAARNGGDLDGRTYTVRILGRDTLGNVGACSAMVTVPHDQGK